MVLYHWIMQQHPPSRRGTYYKLHNLCTSRPEAVLTGHDKGLHCTTPFCTPLPGAVRAGGGDSVRWRQVQCALQAATVRAAGQLALGLRLKEQCSAVACFVRCRIFSSAASSSAHYRALCSPELYAATASHFVVNT